MLVNFGLSVNHAGKIWSPLGLRRRQFTTVWPYGRGKPVKNPSMDNYGKYMFKRLGDLAQWWARLFLGEVTGWNNSVRIEASQYILSLSYKDLRLGFVQTYHCPNRGAVSWFAKSLSSAEADLEERKHSCTFMRKETKGCGYNSFASPPVETNGRVPAVFAGHGSR